MGKLDILRGTTDDEAKSEVEAKLRRQQLTRPLTDKEMTAFCEAMINNLDLNYSALPKVRDWAKSWQTAWLSSAPKA